MLTLLVTFSTRNGEYQSHVLRRRSLPASEQAHTRMKTFLTREYATPVLVILSIQVLPETHPHHTRGMCWYEVSWLGLNAIGACSGDLSMTTRYHVTTIADIRLMEETIRAKNKLSHLAILQIRPIRTPRRRALSSNSM